MKILAQLRTSVTSHIKAPVTKVITIHDIELQENKILYRFKGEKGTDMCGINYELNEVVHTGFESDIYKRLQEEKWLAHCKLTDEKMCFWWDCGYPIGDISILPSMLRLYFFDWLFELAKKLNEEGSKLRLGKFSFSDIIITENGDLTLGKTSLLI